MKKSDSVCLSLVLVALSQKKNNRIVEYRVLTSENISKLFNCLGKNIVLQSHY